MYKGGCAAAVWRPPGFPRVAALAEICGQAEAANATLPRVACGVRSGFAGDVGRASNMNHKNVRSMVMRPGNNPLLDLKITLASPKKPIMLRLQTTVEHGRQHQPKGCFDGMIRV